MTRFLSDTSREGKPNWEATDLLDRYESDAPPEIFILSPVARFLLSKLAEAVKWDTRVDVDAIRHDPLLMDQLSAAREQAYCEMSAPQHLNDLIAQMNANAAIMERVIDAIDDLQLTTAVDTAFGCCDDQPPVVSEPASDASFDPNSTPPLGETSWEDYLCKLAHIYLDDIDRKLGELNQLWSQGAISLRVLLGIMAVWLGVKELWIASITVGVGTAMDLLESLKNIVSGDVFDNARTWLDNQREPLLCCVTDSTSAEGAVQCLNSAVDNSQLNDVTKFLLQTMFIPEHLNILYSGELQDGTALPALPSRYDNVTCPDCLGSAEIDVVVTTCPTEDSGWKDAETFNNVLESTDVWDDGVRCKDGATVTGWTIDGLECRHVLYIEFTASRTGTIEMDIFPISSKSGTLSVKIYEFGNLVHTAQFTEPEKTLKRVNIPGFTLLSGGQYKVELSTDDSRGYLFGNILLS